MNNNDNNSAAKPTGVSVWAGGRACGREELPAGQYPKETRKRNMKILTGTNDNKQRLISRVLHMKSNLRPTDCIINSVAKVFCQKGFLGITCFDAEVIMQHFNNR